MVERYLLLYQSGLGDGLEYEITFNNYSRVVLATGNSNASYNIDDICLEFDMAMLPELVRKSTQGASLSTTTAFSATSRS